MSNDKCTPSPLPWDDEAYVCPACKSRIGTTTACATCNEYSRTPYGERPVPITDRKLGEMAQDGGASRGQVRILAAELLRLRMGHGQPCIMCSGPGGRTAVFCEVCASEMIAKAERGESSPEYIEAHGINVDVPRTEHLPNANPSKVSGENLGTAMRIEVGGRIFVPERKT